jgi:hypothetical protein
MAKCCGCFGTTGAQEPGQQLALQQGTHWVGALQQRQAAGAVQTTPAPRRHGSAGGQRPRFVLPGMWGTWQFRRLEPPLGSPSSTVHVRCTQFHRTPDLFFSPLKLLYRITTHVCLTQAG